MGAGPDCARREPRAWVATASPFTRPAVFGELQAIGREAPRPGSQDGEPKLGTFLDICRPLDVHATDILERAWLMPARGESMDLAHFEPAQLLLRFCPSRLESRRPRR